MTQLLTTTTALVLATGMAFAQSGDGTTTTTDPATTMGSGGLSMGMADLSNLPEACRTGAMGMMGGSLSATTGASDTATDTDLDAAPDTATPGTDLTPSDTTTTADAAPDSTDPAASTDGTGIETATAPTATVEGTASDGTVATAGDSGALITGTMGPAMMTMHSKMVAVHVIPDSDLAFACAMIPHHQGAIDMARAMQIQLEDEELRSMAETMITTHQSEIDRLTAWVADHGAAGQ